MPPKPASKLSLKWLATAENQGEKPIRNFSIDPASSIQTSIADPVFADPVSETPNIARCGDTIAAIPLMAWYISGVQHLPHNGATPHLVSHRHTCAIPNIATYLTKKSCDTPLKILWIGNPCQNRVPNPIKICAQVFWFSWVRNRPQTRVYKHEMHVWGLFWHVHV